jgi:hypothetical protein
MDDLFFWQSPSLSEQILKLAFYLNGYRSLNEGSFQLNDGPLKYVTDVTAK